MGIGSQRGYLGSGIQHHAMLEAPRSPIVFRSKDGAKDIRRNYHAAVYT